MSIKVLKDLYFGHLYPAEQCSVRLQEHQSLIDRDSKDYDEFVKKLPPPLDKEFLRIWDEQTEALPFESAEAFIDGFRLGARMMLEILEEPYSVGGEA